MSNKFVTTLTLILSAIIFLTGCNSSLPPIDTANKSIIKHDNYVFASGHWKETERKGFKKMAKVNIVDIIFDKNSMTCKESFACVYAKGEDELMKINMLSMNNINYKITEWSDDGIIRAVYNAPVADIEIKLSLKDNFAERSYRETGTRGSNTADSNIYSHWVLE